MEKNDEIEKMMEKRRLALAKLGLLLLVCWTGRNLWAVGLWRANNTHENPIHLPNFFFLFNWIHVLILIHWMYLINPSLYWLAPSNHHVVLPPPLPYTDAALRHRPAPPRAVPASPTAARPPSSSCHHAPPSHSIMASSVGRPGASAPSPCAAASVRSPTRCSTHAQLPEKKRTRFQATSTFLIHCTIFNKMLNSFW